MTTETSAYQALETAYLKLYRFEHLQSMAWWDQASNMPPKGNTARGAALAELATLLGEQLDCLEQAALVPVTGRPISQRRAREPHQPARPTLRHAGLRPHRLHRFATRVRA